jgi:hypothetical protein
VHRQIWRLRSTSGRRSLRWGTHFDFIKLVCCRLLQFWPGGHLRSLEGRVAVVVVCGAVDITLQVAQAAWVGSAVLAGLQ